MTIYSEALKQMKCGMFAVINGWRYRVEKGDLQRLNGWWQFPMWPLTDEEINSNEWKLFETLPPYGEEDVQSSK